MKKLLSNKALIKLFFILGISASLIVKALYLQITIELDSPEMARFIIPSALALVAVNVLLFQKRAVYSLIIMDVIVTLVFFADSVYGRYYGIPLTIPILYQVGFMDDVGDSARSLLKLKDLIYVFPYPFMIGYALYFNKILKEKPRWLENAILGILLLASIGFFSYEASGVNRMHHAYERKNIAKDLGVYYFHVYDIVDFAKNRWFTETDLSEADRQLIEAYLESGKTPSESGAYGLGDKNLLIIQVEAMQGFVVDLEVEGEEVTPFLNDLQQRGLYFDNIYHQVAAGNTSDAEFMLNTGLYPAPVGAVNYLHSGNRFESLPEILNTRGYKSTGFHGYQASFWNREVVYSNLGFDDFISKEDFDLDEILGWAISDRSFFRQALDISLIQEPFYSFLVTLSSHHPYDAFRGMEPNTGAFEETQVGDYLKSMRYVDTEIEGLFSRLEAEGVLEETIVVIYGDHSGLYLDQKALLSQLLGLEDHLAAWEKVQKIPLWIIAPGLEQTGVVSKVGGQVNILPTLNDLMDLDHSFLLGESLLADGDGYALKRDGSVYFNNYYYHNGSNTLYDLESLDQIDLTPELTKAIEGYKMDLKISDLILSKNLFTNSEFLKLVE